MSHEGSYIIDQVSDATLELQRLEQQSKILRPLEQRVLTESGLRAEHRVLEIGCGPGFITSLLCELATDGEVLATDTDPKLLARCEQYVTKRPARGLTTMQVQGAKLPLADHRCDFSYLRFVLQHAPERQALLTEVHRTLTDGGIICVLDSDDGLVLQHPEDPMITQLLSTADERQQRKGGDRRVGRKLAGMLHEAGFTAIRTKLFTFTTSDLPFPVLARILLGFKSELSGRRNEIEPWIETTAAKVQAGEYFLAAGVVLATAQKAKTHAPA